MHPTRAFWRSTMLRLAVVATMAGFLLLPVPQTLAFANGAIRKLRFTVTLRGLSADAREEQTAGYYQELLNRSSAVVVRGPRALNDLFSKPVAGAPPTLEALEVGDGVTHQNVEGFLIYRPKPNLDLEDPRFPGIRIVTNGLGFADREYAFERMPGTRRFVVLGDSLARGLGVNPGEGFEALLERSLNQKRVSPLINKYELINLGVAGYRITQVVDIAREIAPRFEPDGYVLVLSWLTVARKWGLHLAQLVEEGRDLKYDFLRQVARKADLKPGDLTSTTEAKLWPFIESAIAWGLQEIQDQVRRDGAELIVVLTPHLKGVGAYDPLFRPVERILRERDIPTISLLDAFDRVDISALDAGDGLHPNARGHEVLHDLLERRISDNPRIWRVFFGEGASLNKVSNRTIQ